MRYALIILLFYTLAAYSQSAPNFTMTDTDGNSWNLYGELGAGKTVVLDFFFVDCVPCQGWTPQVAQMNTDYAGSNSLLVLGISDRDDDASIEQFEQTLGVNYPSGGIDGGGDSITDLYSSWFPFFSWPTYAVICSDTTITWNIPPSQGLTEIRAAIDSCPQVSAGIAAGYVSGLLPFPNPCYDKVDITLPSTGEVHVTLIDVTGRVLWQESTVASNTTLTLELPLLESGNYFLQARMSDIYSVSKLSILRP